MTDTTYYVEQLPVSGRETLLRRVDYADEMFHDGKWIPTKIIIDYMFGHNDNVDTISEAQARKVEPAAFSPPM